MEHGVGDSGSHGYGRQLAKTREISEEEWFLAAKFFREYGIWPDHLGPPRVAADAVSRRTCWSATASEKPVGDRIKRSRRASRGPAAAALAKLLGRPSSLL